MNATWVLPGRQDAATPKRRRRRPRWLVLASFVVLVLLIACALVGPLLSRDPQAQVLADALMPPMSTGRGGLYVLGSDELGRDQLARVLSGLRSTLLLCGASTLAAMLVGSALGILSGYFRGLVDDIVMRIVDVLLAMPGIVTVMLVVTLLGASVPTIILVLSLMSSMTFARVMRSRVIALREQDLLGAVRSLGASTTRIIMRHVVPNTAGLVVVIATLELASLIVVEASLDYLGLGIQPPAPTLGNMIAGGQTAIIAGIWWPVLVPGAAITALIMCVNVIGDWLRDRLDPR